MRTKTATVHTNNRKPLPATSAPSPRPSLLLHHSLGRVGSPRAISFGWARTSARRFGR